uniref:Fe(2+) transport protein 1-like n=1 Tax=Tanacetum cinerariifolium TaxID=118510 RepID=A0A6L2LY42_TANCI|nr:Fe(2+) transport protein 1-like [Tanacetum cinerariifolium]
MALQICGFNLSEGGVGEPIEVPTKVLLFMHEESSKRRKVDEEVQDVRTVAGEDEICRVVRIGKRTINGCIRQYVHDMITYGCFLLSSADYEMKMKGILVFFFSATTPLGIAFGILLSNTKKIDRLHW